MKRLALCLDGTWNKAQSGTNVYHLSNLIKEGASQFVGEDNVAIPCTQEIYYSQGVGTHAFDSVTGGAFGIGLSDIVRDAYDWLVERYEDGNEIYIFGFSRGAFTARSLVGLIARCGLLRRGAPIPPEELWDAYQILGRHENSRTGATPSPNWWELLFGRPKRPFYPIGDYYREAWDLPGTHRPESDVTHPANRAEALMMKWSRRVKITCVGVFDTVGSLGADALAIPGLRSKAAQFHDTNLASLCVNAFHALAIDEHRANFTCIPWRRIEDAAQADGQTELKGQVEQRWFIGSHSNVGGGYPDDVLAQFPLFWMIERCSELGLEFKPLLANGGAIADRPKYENCVPLLDGVKPKCELASSLPTLRDSFAEFLSGAWKSLIRSKPEYRPMGLPPMWENGVVVASANETLDPSVPALRDENRLPSGERKGSHDLRTDYNPPNLYRWAEQDATLAAPDPTLLAFLGGAKRPTLRYIEGAKSLGLLVAWVFLCVRGAHEVGIINGFPIWCAWVVGGVVLLIDWSEAGLNQRMVLAPQGRRYGFLAALLNFFLVARMCAVALVVFGFVSLFVSVRHGVPGWMHSPTWRLLVMDGLLVFLCFGKEWCATSMIEAGLGSIVYLQTSFTPRTVRERLEKWAPGGRPYLLQPVVEALMRDVMGLVPTYVIVNLLGLYYLKQTLADHVGLSPWLGGWSEWGRLHSDIFCWALVIGGAANIAEDVIRCAWVWNYPRPPGAISVLVANLFMATKAGLFTLGLMISFLAVVSLYFATVWLLQLPVALHLAIGLALLVPVIVSAVVWLLPRKGR